MIVSGLQYSSSCAEASLILLHFIYIITITINVFKPNELTLNPLFVDRTIEKIYNVLTVLMLRETPLIVIVPYCTHL